MEVGLLTGAAGLADISQATRSSNRLANDFDTFLVLLTTQLQQQDPLEPLKSSEFTQQLIQFTSVEQAIATNQNLEAVIKLLSGDSVTNLVGFIGKTVTAVGDSAALVDGTAVWQYTLEGNADKTSLVITDAAGKIVFETPGEISSGTHGFVWDGRDNLGLPLADGTYTLSVTARTAAESLVASSTAIQGRVTAIELTGGEPTLVVNGLRVPLGSVSAVSETAPENT